MHYNALGGSVTEQLTVRLPRTLHEDLKRTASRMQRKPSEVVRLALRQFLHGLSPTVGAAGVGAAAIERPAVGNHVAALLRESLSNVAEPLVIISLHDEDRSSSGH